MQYSILINQLQTVKISEKTGVKLDIVDMAIFQFIVDFANSPSCQRDASNEWFWITTKKIIQELPLINLKRRQIYNRLNKLVASKLLVRNPNNQFQSMALCKFGEMFDNYMFSEPYAKNCTPYAENCTPPMQKIAHPYAKNCTPPMQKIAHNQITNISNNQLSNNHNNIKNLTVLCDFEKNHTENVVQQNDFSENFSEKNESSISDQNEKKEKKGCAEKKELAGVVELFNKILDENNSTISRLTKMTDRRATMLMARKREFPNVELKTIFEKMAKSTFLNGGGSTGWKADFDWLIRPNNFPKVLEGNYDNKRNAKTGQINALKFESDTNYQVSNLNW